jgi:WD40 repeat protein
MALAFGPDGGTLFWCRGSLCGRLDLHDPQRPASTTYGSRWTAHIDLPESFHSRRAIACSPDGRSVTVARCTGPILLLDAADGTRQPERFPPNSHATALAFSPDGKSLAAVRENATADGALCVYDVASGRRVAALPGPACALAFSPDGKALVAAGGDGRLRLFDAVNWRPLATYRWHQNGLSDVAFSPDGRWLATCGFEGRVKLWPVDGLLLSAEELPAASGRRRTPGAS